MIITEMTKMSGRGFRDLCSVISEWSRKKARGKYQILVFSQTMERTGEKRPVRGRRTKYTPRGMHFLSNPGDGDRPDPLFTRCQNSKVPPVKKEN